MIRFYLSDIKYFNITEKLFNVTSAATLASLVTIAGLALKKIPFSKNFYLIPFLAFLANRCVYSFAKHKKYPIFFLVKGLWAKAVSAPLKPEIEVPTGDACLFCLESFSEKTFGEYEEAVLDPSRFYWSVPEALHEVDGSENGAPKKIVHAVHRACASKLFEDALGKEPANAYDPNDFQHLPSVQCPSCKKPLANDAFKRILTEKHFKRLTIANRVLKIGIPFDVQLSLIEKLVRESV